MTFILPESWRSHLEAETTKPYWHKLATFVEQERAEHQVYPAAGDVFNALATTAYQDVKVLLLGQDPYHGAGQAHGLCFSVLPGIKKPPSVRNMFKELHSDLGCPIPEHGYLASWAEQGVLMLNAVLTVRAGEANSHKKQGWETFTDAIINVVNDKPEQVIFVLWGAYAQKKRDLIDTSRHIILESAHPSPLSAKSGFFGSAPYSKINNLLKAAGKQPIDWCIAEL